MPHTLNALIDREVFAFVPMLRKDETVPLTIRNVEASGLWVENPLGGVGARRSPDEPYQPLKNLPPVVCFIPWQQIAYILAADVSDIQKRQLQQQFD